MALGSGGNSVLGALLLQDGRRRREAQAGRGGAAGRRGGDVRGCCGRWRSSGRRFSFPWQALRAAPLGTAGRSFLSNPSRHFWATDHSSIHPFTPYPSPADGKVWWAPRIVQELPRRRGTREHTFHPRLFAWGSLWCVGEKCRLDLTRSC